MKNLNTLKLVCKQLSCNSVKDNSDLFLSISIAASATHSLIVKEELRIYCQQMERQNTPYQPSIHVTHISLRPSGCYGSLRLIWGMVRKMSYTNLYISHPVLLLTRSWICFTQLLMEVCMGPLLGFREHGHKGIQLREAREQRSKMRK